MLTDRPSQKRHRPGRSSQSLEGPRHVVPLTANHFANRNPAHQISRPPSRNRQGLVQTRIHRDAQNHWKTIHAAEEGNHNPDERLAQVHASFHSAKIELESNGAVPRKSRSTTKIHRALWTSWTLTGHIQLPQSGERPLPDGRRRPDLDADQPRPHPQRQAQVAVVRRTDHRRQYDRRVLLHDERPGSARLPLNGNDRGGSVGEECIGHNLGRSHP